MHVLSSTFGLDADVFDTGILGREVLRQDDQFTDRLQRRLATGRLAANTAVGALSVERESRPVGLTADELEAAVAARSLCDVRVQVKELINVAAVTREFYQLLIIERARDRWRLFLNQLAFRAGDCHRLGRGADCDFYVGARSVAAPQQHFGDRNLKAGGGDAHAVVAGL